MKSLVNPPRFSLGQTLAGWSTGHSATRSRPRSLTAAFAWFLERDVGSRQPEELHAMTPGHDPRRAAAQRHAPVDDCSEVMLHRKGRKEAKRVSGPRAGINVCATPRRGPPNADGTVAGGHAARSEQTRATMWRASSHVRVRDVTPHVAQKVRRLMVGPPGMRVKTGYENSEVFGWMKTVGGLRKLRHRGAIGSSLSPPRPITWSA